MPNNPDKEFDNCYTLSEREYGVQEYEDFLSAAIKASDQVIVTTDGVSRFRHLPIGIIKAVYYIMKERNPDSFVKGFRDLPTKYPDHAKPMIRSFHELSDNVKNYEEHQDNQAFYFTQEESVEKLSGLISDIWPTGQSTIQNVYGVADGFYFHAMPVSSTALHQVYADEEAYNKIEFINKQLEEGSARLELD